MKITDIKTSKNAKEITVELTDNHWLKMSNFGSQLFIGSRCSEKVKKSEFFALKELLNKCDFNQEKINKVKELFLSVDFSEI